MFPRLCPKPFGPACPTPTPHAGFLTFQQGEITALWERSAVRSRHTEAKRSGQSRTTETEAGLWRDTGDGRDGRFGDGRSGGTAHERDGRSGVMREEDERGWKSPSEAEGDGPQ